MPLTVYSGWTPLSSGFPPTLSKDADPTTLKPNESPDAYGLDVDAVGFLKSGTVPTGTARAVQTNTFVNKSWEWFYNRSWHDTGKTLEYTAPEYDDSDHRQGLGKIRTDTSIVTFMPAFRDRLWVATDKGSNYINNVIDQRGFYTLDDFNQELSCDSSASAMTLNGKPFVSNDAGIFSDEGNEIKEWTKANRSSLAPFASRALTGEYKKRFIVGTNFVVDTLNGNLYDFSTSGFRFTSRTLEGEGHAPFSVVALAVAYEMSSTAKGTIKWQTKFEDEDWGTEEDVKIVDVPGERSWRLMEITQTNRSAHKFAMRITSLSSNIKIREIQVNVKNLAMGSMSE